VLVKLKRRIPILLVTLSFLLLSSCGLIRPSEEPKRPEQSKPAKNNQDTQRKTSQEPKRNGTANPTKNYTQEQIDYFLEITLGAEFGESDPRIRKWTEDLKIKIMGSPTVEDRRTLNKVVNEVNSIVDGIRLEIGEENPNTEIYFVPESDFEKFEPNYVPTNYGFFWTWWNSSNGIYKSRILITTEKVTQTERSHLIREELTQSLGLMKDSQEYQDSIFYQEWTDTTKYSEIDKAIIEMLYLKEILPNMTRNEVESVLADRK